MDRQTDISVCTHVRTHAWTHTCKHSNIDVRSKKSEVRSKKLEVSSCKLGNLQAVIHTCTHSHTHKHAHTDIDPLQSIPLFFGNFWTLADFQYSGAHRVKLCFELLRHSQSQCTGCDTFWRLTDFQDLGANRVKPCFYLLGPTQNHSISLRHVLDIHRLSGFRCQ